MINFPEKISNYEIYNEILIDLTEHYLENPQNNPILSFVKTERINSESIPVLMCLLDIMYNYKSVPIRLELVYRPFLLYYLDHTNFLYYAGKKLKFINYDNELIGGFSNYIEKDYRTEHIMHVYYPVNDYYEKNEDDQLDYRAALYEDMAYHIIPMDYGKIIEDAKQLSDKEKDECIVLLAEVIANAKLYSGSFCYSMFQTDKFATKISIADIGEGFANSLIIKKQSKFYSYNNQRKFVNAKESLQKKYLKNEFNDFYNILEILYYSECQNRINLAYLKSMVVKNNGILRIHTNSTQVIFSYRRCSRCDKKMLDCMGWLLDSSEDFQYAPIKIYPAKLKGIHIEIEFRR